MDYMSDKLWAYNPNRCDEEWCDKNCDNCPKVGDMSAMTDIRELNLLLVDCRWRHDIDGTSVCKAHYVPCEMAIGHGKCEVCAEYFGGIVGQ